MAKESDEDTALSSRTDPWEFVCYTFALLFLFFLSNYQTLSLISIAVMALSIVLSGDLIQGFKNLFNKRILLLPVVYYLLHAVSLIYTSNYQYAFFDLGTKVSLLVIPLVFAVFTFSRTSSKHPPIAFILGCLCASVYCLTIAANSYLHTGDTSSFLYISFSKFLHPTYFAIILNLAVLIAFDQLMVKKKMKKIWKEILISSMLINSVVIILLLSRAAMAVFVCTFIAMIVIYALEKRILKMDWKWIVGLILVLGLVFVATTRKYNRFEQVENAIEASSQQTVPDTMSTEPAENSTTARIHIWKESISLIKENLLIGVGIGDIKDELIRKYAQDNFDYGVKQRFNPHNQYLHTAVSLGIIGLIVLLVMLFTPLFRAFKNRDWIFILFLVIIILNGITESILERQAGILFFVFFYCMFAFRNYGSDDEVEDIEPQTNDFK